MPLQLLYEFKKLQQMKIHQLIFSILTHIKFQERWLCVGQIYKCNLSLRFFNVYGPGSRTYELMGQCLGILSQIDKYPNDCGKQKTN